MSTPFILILGENGSGKSLYAEALMRRAPLKKRVYIATMQPYGDEGARRVEKHRRQRAGDGYDTLEAPRHIDLLPVERDAAVLLEDVSNLVANLYFDPAEPAGPDEAVREIGALRENCGALVAVTVVMPDSRDYEDGTAGYIEAVNAANAALMELSDAAVRLTGGEPRLIKGELPW